MRMLKICRSTIYRLLEIVFKEDLSTGLFPSEWKKGKSENVNAGVPQGYIFESIVDLNQYK